MTENQKSALAAGFMLLVAGLMASTVLIGHPDSTRTHSRIEWQGDAPDACVCARYTVVGPSMTWSLLGLDELTDEDGGILPTYARAELRVAAPDVDGSIPRMDLPPGMEIVEMDSCDCKPGDPQLEVWRLDDPSAPLPCACAPTSPIDGGAACEFCPPTVGADCVWGPPQPQRVMMPGEFRGSCIPAVCLETDIFAPGASLPKACK